MAAPRLPWVFDHGEKVDFPKSILVTRSQRDLQAVVNAFEEVVVTSLHNKFISEMRVTASNDDIVTIRQPEAPHGDVSVSVVSQRFDSVKLDNPRFAPNLNVFMIIMQAYENILEKRSDDQNRDIYDDTGLIMVHKRDQSMTDARSNRGLACSVCSKSADNECGKCGTRIYCGEQCQLTDWTQGGHAVRCDAPMAGVEPLADFPADFNLDNAEYISSGTYGIVLRVGNRVVKLQMGRWRKTDQYEIAANKETMIMREVDAMKHQFNPYVESQIERYFVVSARNLPMASKRKLRMILDSNRKTKGKMMHQSLVDLPEPLRKALKDSVRPAKDATIIGTVIAYINGGTLSDLCKSGKDIDGSLFKKLAFGLAWSMYTMQLNLGFTHNDLKANNIMCREPRADRRIELFSPQESRDIVKKVFVPPPGTIDPIIIDFGLSETNLTRRANVSSVRRAAAISGSRDEWWPFAWHIFPMEMVARSKGGLFANFPRRGQGADNWSLGRVFLVMAFNGTPMENGTLFSDDAIEDPLVAELSKDDMDGVAGNYTDILDAMEDEIGVFSDETMYAMMPQLLVICTIQHYLKNGFVPTLRPGSTYRLSDTMRFLGESETRERVLDMMEKLPGGNFYRKAVDHANDKLGPDGMDMLRRLFSWTPWEDQNVRPADDFGDALLERVIKHKFFADYLKDFSDYVQPNPSSVTKANPPIKWFGYGLFEEDERFDTDKQPFDLNPEEEDDDSASW